MFLIADAGSRKTSWAKVSVNSKESVITPGINPQLQDNDFIENIISGDLIPFCRNDEIRKIYYYGAGCGREKNRNKINEILLKYFPGALIDIKDDLTGAGRALFFNDKGIACILGTGSNSGVYNGREIIERIPSLGFILGDEGSGTHIGKLFIRDVFYDYCPEKFRTDFLNEYNLTKEEILNNVYLAPKQNTFLANISKFVIKNKNESYFNDLIKNSLEEYYKHHILPYKQIRDLELGFVGSIAWHNSDILYELAAKYGNSISSVIKMPIENLIEYHVNLTCGK